MSAEGVAAATPPTRARRQAEPSREPADRAFRAYLRGGGAAVLAIMTLIGLFLAIRAASALKIGGLSFFHEAGWQPDQGHGHFGVAGMLIGTLLIAMVAILVALPVALATALYISEYAPRRLRGPLVSLIDLMAAVPSLAYGLWGFYFLQDHLIGLARWISTYFGWIPLFHVDGADPHDPTAPLTVYKSSSFVAGLVVAMMVTPLVCSLMREVFSQAPAGEREGAYALGATRWGMIRTVVLPFGYGGMIGATMLGLGRAFGETIGVYLVISQIFAIQPHVLQNGGSSIAASIAELFGAASHQGISALMAAGLTLFIITLAVNVAASAIISRTRSGAMSEV